MDLNAAVAFWEWSDDRMGFFHLYSALAAVILGPVIFLRRKGDLTHRLLGLFYVFAMLSTNATALTIYDFTSSVNIFHAFAVVSLITTLAGLIAIVVYGASKTKAALSGHIELMSWSYFGLFMATGAEVFTRGIGPLITNYTSFWIFFGVYMLIAGAVGNIVTVKLIKGVKRRWLEPG